MKIFAWLSDKEATGYYRLGLPFRTLAKQGHDVTCSEKMPDSVLHEGQADVIIGQRVCLPAPTKSWQRLAREGRSKLVYEVDDDLLGVDPSNRPAFRLFNQPEIRKNIVDNVTMSDLVVTTNEHLAELLSEYNPNVAILPNFVPEWMLTHDRPELDHTVIGWGGGTSHARDFGEVAKPLRRFLQGHTDVEFHNVGMDYTARVASIRGRTRHTPWYRDVEQYLANIDFDIGICPLMVSSFNESKSPIKLLELSALGIPAVVSPTGPYRRALEAGSPALTAMKAREWTEALTTLATEPETRAQLGKAAREWAATQTIEANAHLWLEAYSRI